MIIASLKVKVSPENHQDALKTVRSMIGPTRVKPGCKGIVFCQDTDDPDTMILIERWHTRKDFEDHIRSDEYRRILALIDLSTEPPEIQLNQISQTEGLEAIEGIRAKPLS
ncbi:MAG: antibiotic biosynthesis monooxygenase [Desulfobacterales bacterium]|nr:MAG: antibiotic biosynthesis monooxygenase [Desulfobacterales bacterium]